MEENKLDVLTLYEEEGCLLPLGFNREVFKNCLKYKPVDGDFFITTYPKCGTTWTQQIVYLIYNRGQPILNMGEFWLRSPYLEMFGKEGVEKMVRPGGIKIHLPFHLTPYSNKAKYLYVARNPKDVLKSCFHHYTTDPLFLFQDGTFPYFFERFMKGDIMYNDYFDHLLGWYEHRHDPNVLFLTYEELKRDTRETILKIAKFMGDEWLNMLEKDATILDNVLKYSSVEFMKTIFNSLDRIEFPEGEMNQDEYPGLTHVLNFVAKNRRETDEKLKYIRKGAIGDWKTSFTNEQSVRMDKKIEEKLKGTELYSYWKNINCL